MNPTWSYCTITFLCWQTWFAGISLKSLPVFVRDTGLSFSTQSSSGFHARVILPASYTEAGNWSVHLCVLDEFVGVNSLYVFGRIHQQSHLGCSFWDVFKLLTQCLGTGLSAFLFLVEFLSFICVCSRNLAIFCKLSNWSAYRLFGFPF